VAWFQRVYAQLAGERWEALYAGALYASGGYGHGRARLFADAIGVAGGKIKGMIAGPLKHCRWRGSGPRRFSRP